MDILDDFSVREVVQVCKENAGLLIGVCVENYATFGEDVVPLDEAVERFASACGENIFMRRKNCISLSNGSRIFFFPPRPDLVRMARANCFLIDESVRKANPNDINAIVSVLNAREYPYEASAMEDD